jgi:hypothetical protein
LSLDFAADSEDVQGICEQMEIAEHDKPSLTSLTAMASFFFINFRHISAICTSRHDM